MRKKISFVMLLFALSLSSFSQNERTTINITDGRVTVVSYTDNEVIINGKCDLHLTSSTQPLSNSIVRLNAENSWLFIDNIKPSVVISSILQFIYVNNQLAVNKSNVRVAIYKHGTVIMPHSPSYKPLTVFTDQNFSGDSSKYALFSRYTSLGTLNNAIRSFRLKRGYMATLATSSDGTGYSRVFIADDEDLEVSTLPFELEKVISFIRVYNWEWVSKKGWCGSGSGGTTDGNKVNATWFYSWSADQSSSSTLEYVPIRQKLTWPGWSEINGKQYVTHVLGYNEPDHGEQHKDDNGGKPLTVSQALAQWPDMLCTGLRVGSPACTDFTWLYQFMDSCKARNYRVDYVAVHAYWGGKTPQNWYNDLKYIHDRTGRPIWVTEWNNGADWTSEWWPSDVASQQTKQLNDIKAILTVLDTAHFIERYSIFNWVGDKRAMILSGALTPAGQYYADNKSAMAFNRTTEAVPKYLFGNKPSLSIAFGSKTLSLTLTDPNGEYFKGFVLEKQTDNGTYAEFYNSDNLTLKNCPDTLDLSSARRVRYRVRTKLPDGSLSGYSNEIGFDISNGSDIQYGNVYVSNVGWNPIFFKVPYSNTPTIIVGSPTNKNISVLLSSRAKLVNYASRFNLQLAPWSYQKVTSLGKEETVPYLILNAGSYNFGGLEAQAGKNSVAASWTPVTFTTPFNADPVVFTTQLNPLTTYATTVRVRNVTKTGFEARLQKETAIKTTLLAETVSYFAITPGTGIIDSKKLIVGKTANNAVGSIYSSITYGDSIADPIFIAQMQTCNDDTVTAFLRTLYLANKYANVVKQREKSTGVLTMSLETAGWMVIDSSTVIDGMNAPKTEELRLYPNPVKDFIYLSKTFPEGLKADVYNIFGLLIKTFTIFDNVIDVKDIPAGYYILRTPKHGSKKFIKI